MKSLRIFGIVVILAGLGAIFFSNYIMNQVNAGKVQIQQGENAVNKGNQLFSMNPVAQEVGQNLTAPAQKKIKAGKEQVAQYQLLAGQLRTGGIVGIVVGAGSILAS